MDLHVMAFMKNPPTAPPPSNFLSTAVPESDFCRTWYSEEDGCHNITLDIDSSGGDLPGGLEGPETVTLWDTNNNQHYVYVIGAHDYDDEDYGLAFLKSKATIEVTNGVTTEVAVLTADSIDTSETDQDLAPR